MLEVIDLTVAYGPVVALHGVSLTVADGSMTTVLGANGAGKTTLVRTISGLTRPRGGSVRLDGRDITRMPPEEIARLGVAHVPQGQGVLAELTVDENLRLGGLWRRDLKGQRTALAEAYDLFPPLATRRHVAAFSLSGGERQMLSVGRALVARSRVLLLDEPSLGLAPLVLVQIMARIKALVMERGLTVLLIEQNAKSALSVADEGIVLQLGKVVARGRAHQLLSKEGLRHAYLGF
ncbi:MAG: ABC transporter ATP-binding protein [Candidatus Rokubacteria bacterium 13_1_40CM_4_67_11]|nr:MAG: ABC transporter ATP-binding protein [Candidatus Rokubacteria bacterium 13_1_40CM_4_67_11]